MGKRKENPEAQRTVEEARRQEWSGEHRRDTQEGRASPAPGKRLQIVRRWMGLERCGELADAADD